ncbi:cytochrome P450 [Mycena crocata]|nr:cytochrome P450 [Mycena crocata]
MLQAYLLFSTALLAVLWVAMAIWQRRAIKVASHSVAIPRYTSITYPILGSLQYFAGHWDFLRDATQNGSASFHLARQRCIALPVESRQAFFSDSRLSFALGYAVMLGATPSMNKDFLRSMGFDITLGGRSTKFLAALMRKERVDATTPTLYAYAAECIDGLAATTNPFESIYGTIFRLTVNTIGARSIAASPTICDALMKIFHELDQAATPVTILFPWFCGPERMQRFYLMKRFYDIMSAAIEQRRKDGRNDDDPIQYVIDAGLSPMEITQFTLAALFAGIANTGVVAAYILCDLATHPDYLVQVREELKAFVALFNPDKSLPLHARIQTITYDDWTTAGRLPVLERCLKETIRLRIATPLHRLNDTGKDIEMAGVLVPRDTIVSFHTSFMHHNEDMYADPLTWDPERFSEGREEGKSVPMSFAGWGAGKHQCLGKKFATFEIFLVTALTLSSYEIEVIDKDGQHMAEMPPADLDNALVSPPTVEVKLRLSPRL